MARAPSRPRQLRQAAVELHGCEIAGEIIALKKADAYREANFSHFKELLEEREDIKISYSALCSLLEGRVSSRSASGEASGSSGGSCCHCQQLKEQRSGKHDKIAVREGDTMGKKLF